MDLEGIRIVSKMFKKVLWFRYMRVGFLLANAEKIASVTARKRNILSAIFSLHISRGGQ